VSAAGSRDRTARSEDGFDPVIHAPARLRLCAALDASDEAEFSGVREILQISKSALSKHVTTLVEVGYVEQRRAVRDTRQRVWLRLTPLGRKAYREHVAALRAIVRAAPEIHR
jgi:DNA-binding MarR family transcriptional regulator